MVNYIESDDYLDYRGILQLDKYLQGHNGYIAGGVFKNIFNGEKFKDVDIFFRSNKDFLEAVNVFENSDEYDIKYKNKKVIAYINKETKVTVELICHTFAEPEFMISRFDFTITKFAYYTEKNEYDSEDYVDEEGNAYYISKHVVHHENFFMHLHFKRLVIDEVDDELFNPHNTLNRTYKYAKYGYYPCKGTKVKLLKEIKSYGTIDEDDLSGSLYDGID